MAVATTIRELKDTSNKQRPFIMFLMETRFRRSKAKSFKLKMGYDYNIIVDPIGLARGFVYFGIRT